MLYRLLTETMICDLKQPGTTGALDDKNLTEDEFCSQMTVLMNTMREVDLPCVRLSANATYCEMTKELFRVSISPLLAEAIRQLTNSEMALNNRCLVNREFQQQIAVLIKLVQVCRLNRALV